MGEYNYRGTKSLQIRKSNMRIGSTYLKKKMSKKWTRKSRNTAPKNEIDYIQSKKNTVLNADAIKRVHFRRNERVTMGLNTSLERSKMIRCRMHLINIEVALMIKKDDLQEKFQNRFEVLSMEGDIEEIAETRMRTRNGLQRRAEQGGNAQT